MGPVVPARVGKLRAPLACTRCRQMEMKCTRQSPTMGEAKCTRCKMAGAECIVPVIEDKTAQADRKKETKKDATGLRTGSYTNSSRPKQKVKSKESVQEHRLFPDSLNATITGGSFVLNPFEVASVKTTPISDYALFDDSDIVMNHDIPQQTSKYDTHKRSWSGAFASSPEYLDSHGYLALPPDTLDRSRHVEDLEQQCISTTYDRGNPLISFCADTASYWFAAEHAHQHAVSCKDQIAAEFNRHSIQEHQYAVYAGFDEFLIKSRGGYLEQIHVMSSVDLGVTPHADSSLLFNLGRIFSPFSAVLFTPSSTYEIPVYKSDGTMWEFDELVYHTATRFNAETGDPQRPTSGPVAGPYNHPSLISLCQSPSDSSPSGFSSTGSDGSPGNSSNASNGKGKGKEVDDTSEGGRHNEDDTSDDEPGDLESDPDPFTDSVINGEGRVVINLVSEIYSSQQRMKECIEGDFQKLSMRGAFDIKAHSENSKTPEVKVKFSDLRFGSERKVGHTAYNQYHLRVKVISGAQTADITGISPRRTSAFERAVKDSLTTKTVRSGGFNIVGGNKGVQFQGTVGVNGTISKERSHGLEKTKLLDQIAETSSDGSTRWDFNIDDPSAQECGVHLSDDRLPAVDFRFPATTLPDRVTVSIVSFWSLVVPEGQSQSWISKLFYGPTGIQSKNMPAYSNLCQALTVAVSPRIKGEHQHKTKMYVNSGNAALDFHTRTECISPLSSGVDVSTDITNARCPSGSPGSI